MKKTIVTAIALLYSPMSFTQPGARMNEEGASRAGLLNIQRPKPTVHRPTATPRPAQRPQQATPHAIAHHAVDHAPIAMKPAMPTRPTTAQSGLQPEPVEIIRQRLFKAMHRRGDILKRILTAQPTAILPALVKAVDECGNTVLHSAAMNDNVQAAQMLIENGANVNSVNFDGRTPLHLARTMEMAMALVEHGAHINATDDDGKTALERAQKRRCRYEAFFHQKNTHLSQLTDYLSQANGPKRSAEPEKTIDEDDEQ